MLGEYTGGTFARHWLAGCGPSRNLVYPQSTHPTHPWASALVAVPAGGAGGADSVLIQAC